MNDEERQKLMQSFIADTEAKSAELKAAQEERKAGQVQAEKPVNLGGGTITVEGKSLGRTLAGNEERDGERYLNRNPEDVIIGGKRDDWDHSR
ncbi:MAG TPA: hypothetical protein PLI45_00320 [Candidatus Woesebacteria bacterium]|nr:hypothetical protein [Candidatus Woesebacteria bacterium]